ncbi:MAG: DUF4260 domain-containing protein [Bryobacteraceae bacterium]
MPTRPDVILKVEGLVVLIAACILYARLGGGWGWFALSFMIPDVSILPYLARKRIGGTSYNLVHSYTLPLAVALWGFSQQHALTIGLSLIWIAHIGFDRALGFGLKFPQAFRPTHIQSAAVFRESAKL